MIFNNKKATRGLHILCCFPFIANTTAATGDKKGGKLLLSHPIPVSLASLLLLISFFQSKNQYDSTLPSGSKMLISKELFSYSLTSCIISRESNFHFLIIYFFMPYRGTYFLISETSENKNACRKLSHQYIFDVALYYRFSFCQKHYVSKHAP